MKEKKRLKWDPVLRNWYYRRWRSDRKHWVRRCDQCGELGLIGRYRGWVCDTCCRASNKALSKAGARAHRRVSGAIRKGLLPKLDGSVACVDCSRPALVYDHRHYSSPLDVQPVCKPCNWKRGPAAEVAHMWRKPFTRPA